MTGGNTWIALAPFILILALVVARVAKTVSNAKAGRDDDLRRLTEQTVVAHEHTKHQLDQINSRLGDITSRMAKLETILKDIE